MGCLTFPLRLLGVLLVLAAAAGLLLYRDQSVSAAKQLLGMETRVETSGRASIGTLRPARRKLAELTRGRVDSVVLTAEETITLLTASLDESFISQIDSLELRLGAERLRVSGRLRTATFPRSTFGPLNAVVRDVEPVELAGNVVTVDPTGRAEWRVREVEVRGIPLPTPLVTAMIRKVMVDSTATGIPLTLPPGARAIRVTPTGLILYTRPRE